MKALEIEEYLTDTYGECRHNAQRMAYACNTLSDQNDLDSRDVFHLIVDDKPIEYAHTHSYGFHTGNGRDLINKFTELYNENKDEDYEY